jgi:hypothetical protein
MGLDSVHEFICRNEVDYGHSAGSLLNRTRSLRAEHGRSDCRGSGVIAIGAFVEMEFGTAVQRGDAGVASGVNAGIDGGTPRGGRSCGRYR